VIIVSATSDQVRNTLYLLGSAHPTKASIAARSQAYEKASPNVRPAEAVEAFGEPSMGGWSVRI